MKGVIAFLVAVALAAGAGAQVRPQAAATSPAAVPNATPSHSQTSGPGLLSPHCFEAVNPSDTALLAALSSAALLCPTSTKSGYPVRLVATPAGELSAEASGTPTAWVRNR